MKVTLLNAIKDLENHVNAIPLINEFIDTTIGEKPYFFNYMVIDGVEVYDDWEDYILENITSINEILIEVFTISEMTQDILISIREYLENNIPKIYNLGDAFYIKPKESDWHELENLFEALEWMISTFQSIDKNKNAIDSLNNYMTWNQYAEKIMKLGETVKEFSEALDNKDHVLIGDVIKYELTPSLKEILNIANDL